MPEVYRYKLNHRDFLKLAKGNLPKNAKYLFLQNHRVEIEIYLEEVITSTNHRQFKSSFGDFYNKYGERVNDLMTSILGEAEDREFFKIRLNDDKFLIDLVEAYKDLMEVCMTIQKKLINNIDRNHFPITIVCNSYILNRLATRYQEHPTGKSIPVDQAKTTNAVSLRDIQVWHLHVNMLSPVYLEDPEEISKGFRDNWVINQFKERRKQGLGFITMQDKSIIDALNLVEIYSLLIKQDFQSEILNKSENKLGEISLPYFNNPTRKVNMNDWKYRKLNMPSVI